VPNRAELNEWRRAVAAQLADPASDPFVASLGRIVVLGGTHTGYDYCWCQPTMLLQACGHRHGEHKEVMD
jgi:hypothetical protein